MFPGDKRFKSDDLSIQKLLRFDGDGWTNRRLFQGRSTRYGCYGFGRTTFYSIYPCMANLCILFHDIAIQF